MVRQPELDAADREFFTLVSRAVFTNPFSDERPQLDALIAGDPEVAAAERRVRLKRIHPRVSERLERLDAQGRKRIQDFAGPDRALMEYAYLFDLYHRFLDGLDGLIEAQARSEAPIAPVPFARDALELMDGRGFSPEDARRFFALFFQLRRAYHFIEQSLVGRSPSMKALRLSLWNNVFTHDIRIYDRYLWGRMETFSTLLLGETGTGKGTAAAAIGRSGYIPFDGAKGAFAESFTRTFTAINLSQFPETLIESELFGHRKGAFTGAVENHEGVFALCSSHGAIFLDEIGDVGEPVQIKLLQVLQERVFSPVGSHEKKRFGGRVIAATNRSIDALRSDGAFRDDFFYRLCSDVITIPPLRQRIAEDPGELDELISLTLERMTGEPSPELAGLVREVLEKKLPPDYTWPGNVRELEQAARRILLTRSYEGDRQAAGGDLRTRLLRGIESGSLSGQELLEVYCTLLYQRHGSYEEVARRADLDRRTVKKYIVENEN